jgi:hypothetical protein
MSFMSVFVALLLICTIGGGVHAVFTPADNVLEQRWPSHVKSVTVELFPTPQQQVLSHFAQLASQEHIIVNKAVIRRHIVCNAQSATVLFRNVLFLSLIVTSVRLDCMVITRVQLFARVV